MQVTNASIRLPQDGYLVLNSGCRGLTFQNIQFRGVHACHWGFNPSGLPPERLDSETLCPQFPP